MEGAFNELALTLSPGASEADVIARLDTLLRPYGGSGAYGREQQVSHQFVSSEITETQVTSILLPTIFLGVTVFLLHMVLSRLVATQREQVGVLKAFGYSSSAIALHFAGLAVITMISGAILGAALGLYLARGLANVYAQFFQFPSTTFIPDFRIALAALLIASVSGIVGAATAALRAARLPAAVAMRPEAPPHYSRGILDRVGILRLPLTGRIIIRNIGRAPLKAGLFVLGVALAAALFLTTRYMFDAIDYIARVQFDDVHRWDIMVAFDRPLGDPVKYELAQLRGVQQVEPFRAIAARLTAGSRQQRIELWGLVSDPALRRVVDARRISWPPPDDGILITARLANKLRVEAGDVIRLEVLTGERVQTDIRVAGEVDELLGMSAYMSEGALRRTLREAPLYSGAFLTVMPSEVEGLYRELNRLPRVSGVSSLHTARASFDETIAESFRISLSIAVLFAIIIACGVVYNGARISLSERGRELASLRILGFSRAEVARMLLGEQGVLTLFALPLGFLFGVMLCWLVSVRFESDLFRIPLVLEPRSFVLTAVIILAAALASGLAVGARIYRLDLVSVLKTRE
ncbi:MAG TPA: FtsX-like permease family protein, partial [Longimicrobiales bacterium]